MRAWLAQHGFALRDALGRFGHHLLPAVFNVVVIGVAVSLPLSLYVAVKNLGAVTGQLDAEPQLTLFMAPDAGPEEAEAVGTRLAQHAAVGKHHFVPKAEALDGLKRNAGMAEIIDNLGRNPLPDAWIVSGRGGDPAALEALRREAAGWPKVDHAQLDTAWARKLDTAVRVGRAVTLLVAGLLAVALAAVTFNTIRLQILTRREEIEVSKLIGATDGFIRRPFLYFGLLQGIVGGLAACGLVWGALATLEAQVGPALLALAPDGGLMGLEAREAAAVLAAASGLGWLGAWLSVTQHLWRIG
ncbi:MAG: permease-like cell division protein FtsX [Burkholderiales bacterium]|nr:permease-like cell division protein FtsX [Burkholderiales bacterium]